MTTISASITIGMNGALKASASFASAAQRTTQAFQPDSRVDATKAVVDQIQSKQDFKANLATIRTADEMYGALLDILA